MRSFAAPIALQLLVIILLLNFEGTPAAVTKFTNLKCESFNTSLITFPECKLNVVGRGIISLNVYAKIKMLPITKLMINLGLYQKANGYKPFLYNTTADYCKFADKSVNNVFLMMAMNFVKGFSNFNHSCPINHDVQITNMLISENKFRLLPLPTGEYMMYGLYGFADKNWQASLKVYFTRTE